MVKNKLSRNLFLGSALAIGLGSSMGYINSENYGVKRLDGAEVRQENLHERGKRKVEYETKDFIYDHPEIFGSQLKMKLNDDRYEEIEQFFIDYEIENRERVQELLRTNMGDNFEGICYVEHPSYSGKIKLEEYLEEEGKSRKDFLNMVRDDKDLDWWINVDRIEEPTFYCKYTFEFRGK